VTEVFLFNREGNCKRIVEEDVRRSCGALGDNIDSE
jgi:hypothetical protein